MDVVDDKLDLDVFVSVKTKSTESNICQGW